MLRYKILLWAGILTGSVSYSQQLQGEYFITTSNGEIVLTFQSPQGTRIAGEMIDDNGARYSLNGETPDGTRVSGMLNASGSILFFEASSDMNGLVFNLIPPGIDQQPDHTRASRFNFQRRSETASGLQDEQQTGPSPGNAGGPLTGGGNPGWTGDYTGSIHGTPSVLHMVQQGDHASGSIDAGGYVYHLEGTVGGDGLDGKITDSNTGAAMDYTATRQENRIILELEVPDSYGQTSRLQLQFTKSGSEKTSPAVAGEGFQSSKSEQVSRDPNLIGGWRHNESYTSGDFGAVSEWYLQINGDGTYRYGDGQFMGGGSGTSFDSGRGDASTGRWKTENNIIYINEGSGWHPYAGYYVEGKSMMFKFNDGTKQLWERYSY